MSVSPPRTAQYEKDATIQKLTVERDAKTKEIIQLKQALKKAESQKEDKSGQEQLQVEITKLQYSSAELGTQNSRVTADTNLDSKLKEVSEEKDTLSQERTQLEEQVASLSVENSSLKQASEKLIHEKNVLEEQVTSLSTENSNLKQALEKPAPQPHIDAGTIVFSSSNTFRDIK